MLHFLHLYCTGCFPSASSQNEQQLQLSGCWGHCCTTTHFISLPSSLSYAIVDGVANLAVSQQSRSQPQFSPFYAFPHLSQTGEAQVLRPTFIFVFHQSSLPCTRESYWGVSFTFSLEQKCFATILEKDLNYFGQANSLKRHSIPISLTYVRGNPDLLLVQTQSFSGFWLCSACLSIECT